MAFVRQSKSADPNIQPDFKSVVNGVTVVFKSNSVCLTCSRKTPDDVEVDLYLTAGECRSLHCMTEMNDET